MSFFGNFHKNTINKETVINDSELYISYKKKVNASWINRAFKGVLIWVIGGFVSVLPVFVYSFMNLKNSENLFNVFFSNKDLFLAETTLTISSFLEMVYSTNKGIITKLFIALGFVLLIISFYFYTLEQYLSNLGSLKPYIPYICFCILGTCILYSVISYIISTRIDGKEE